MDDNDLQRVIEQYDLSCPDVRIEPLGGAGGFSGARFWRLETPSGRLCLRCWPSEHPRPEQLQQIHSVLLHAQRQGLSFIPAPLIDRRGRTFSDHGRHLWELSRWMPGTADFHQRPSLARLEAALQALARFHCAAAHIGTHARAAPPSLCERRDWLQSLLSGGIHEIGCRVSRGAWPELEPIARCLLEKFPVAAPRVLRRLVTACAVVSPVHPCIRDIWHDHVLFQGEEVTGFVDFGALRTDHAAVDIARLLGSLVGDERESWRQGLAAYQQLRRLSPEELPLIEAADESNVLLSGLNWLRWIYVDGRQFDQRAEIIRRLEGLLARLQRLAARA